MPRLYYLLRGIKRTQGNRHSRPLRLPITVVHLKRILIWLCRSALPINDRRLWWSACTLAFFGLLRASEYTSPTVSTTCHWSTLSLDDISFNTITALACPSILKHPRPIPSDRAVLSQLGPHTVHFVPSMRYASTYHPDQVTPLHLCSSLQIILF